MSWESSTKFLVLVNHKNNETNWVKEIIFPTIVCTESLSINLLSFIVDNYENLPENIINLHDREYRFYHEGSLVKLLNDPSFEVAYQQLQVRGFWNFGTQKFGCDKLQIKNMTSSGWWKDCMEPYFGSINDFSGYTHGRKSYWQFVVNRDRIKLLPKEFYSNIIDWINNHGVKEHQRDWTYIYSLHNIEKYLEYSWELIFSSKRQDEITILPDGRRCTVSYGTAEIRKDITDVAILKCYNHDKKKFVIEKNVNWNELFGDVAPDKHKYVTFEINDQVIHISESLQISI